MMLYYHETEKQLYIAVDRTQEIVVHYYLHEPLVMFILKQKESNNLSIQTIQDVFSYEQ